MIEIKVFGSSPPCARCKEVEKGRERRPEKYPGRVSVTKLSAFDHDGKKYNIMMTPTVVVNDKVAFVGKVPSKDELEQAIGKAIAENKEP